ncbi:MAG: hypothetical protein Q7S47_00325 [bacterium]|nr:hypothetical protein [bacterium]
MKVARVESKKNGLVFVRHSFSGLQLWVDGYDQTSDYTNAMWRATLARIPAKTHVKHVLLFGLGGGGVLSLLGRRFPGCHVTAVEWDPVMVELTKKNVSPEIFSRFEILLGDAAERVQSIARSTDCIIVDLFRGKKVSPLVCRPSFVLALQKLLKPYGHLLVNMFEEPHMAEAYKGHFSLQERVVYKYNTLFIYRNYGAGIVGAPLPDGYVPYRMCKGYMTREAAVQRATTIIGSEQCPGYRTRYGRFFVDKLFGDEEPNIEKTDLARLVAWRPFTRTDRPKGWLQSRHIGNIGLTGFATITSEYWKGWDSHAQRHRLRWMRQNEWVLEEVSLEVFLAAYGKTKKELTLKKLFSAMLKRKMRGHGDRVRLVGVRRAEKGSPIHAGFASLTIPESRQAVHLISFIHAAARDSGAGVGMMNDWFAHGQQIGLQYLDFGLFWHKGEPKSWQPWSNFKSQFNMFFLMHPDPMMRLVGKK